MHLGGNPTVDEALKSWPRDISDLRCRGYPEESSSTSQEGSGTMAQCSAQEYCLGVG
jgi:hypothetical protein